MEAAIAGDFGVPVVMITGDSAGIEEASSLFPEVYCVIVKDAIGRSSGLCYPLSLTTALIQGAANQLVDKLPDVEPYRFDGQVTLEVELKEGDYLQTVKRLFADSMKDEVTLVFEGERVLDVWVDYINKKREARAAG
jgi:D-amino peptidase